jgi:hypothetical protein
MSDFRVHPVLTSPAVAAVVLAAVGMTLVDAGVVSLLQEVTETPVNAETWGDIVTIRWVVAAISAAFGGFAWFVLFSRTEIRVPAAGVVLGIIGPLMGIGLVWSLYHSVNAGEFEAAKGIIWRISVLWSALAVLLAVGCARLGLRSYRMIRGQ